MRNLDTFRGCLIGGAAGDALGYTVEFMREEQIFRTYGPQGITAYDLIDGVGQISDDTQMTLFTANGLLLGRARNAQGPAPADVYLSYLDWLKTQGYRSAHNEGPCNAWLGNLRAMYKRRAPGTTCLSALRSGNSGSVEEPINNSKGCGGVMRVAPVGLYFCDQQRPLEEICRFGAETAALTHGHPLGWMPAAALAQIIYEISQDGTPLTDAVQHALDEAEQLWPESESRAYFLRLMRRAVALAGQELSDLDAIHQLGEGWVAEETLAIAVYCALKYPGDIDRVLIAAANHNGDSDSTAAVAGNIVGAQVGLAGIPPKYTENLELYDVILQIADDLWRDCPPDGSDPAWEEKYGGAGNGKDPKAFLQDDTKQTD